MGHNYIHSFILLFGGCNSCIEQLWQKPYGLWCLKYLLLYPLQRTFSNCSNRPSMSAYGLNHSLSWYYSILKQDTLQVLVIMCFTLNTEKKIKQPQPLEPKLFLSCSWSTNILIFSFSGKLISSVLSSLKSFQHIQSLFLQIFLITVQIIIILEQTR